MNASGTTWSGNRLSYVRVGAHDRRRMGDIATKLFGLQPVSQDPDQTLLRSDDRHHTLAFVAEGAEAIGIEVLDIAGAADRLRSTGFEFREATEAECARRHVRQALFARDASGNAIEFVFRPSRSAPRFFPPHDVGVTGLKAVALRSTDITADTRFWLEVVGAEVADWAGDITYLRFDDVHHRVALYPSTRSGILYHSYGVTDLNAIMRSYYRFSDHQIEIVHGPGSETVSRDAFLRVRANGGPIISFVAADPQTVETSEGPRQFELRGTALCQWGSRCETVPELTVHT